MPIIAQQPFDVFPFDFLPLTFAFELGFARARTELSLSILRNLNFASHFPQICHFSHGPPWPIGHQSAPSDKILVAPDPRDRHPHFFGMVYFQATFVHATTNFLVSAVAACNRVLPL